MAANGNAAADATKPKPKPKSMTLFIEEETLSKLFPFPHHFDRVFSEEKGFIEHTHNVEILVHTVEPRITQATFCSPPIIRVFVTSTQRDKKSAQKGMDEVDELYRQYKRLALEFDRKVRALIGHDREGV